MKIKFIKIEKIKKKILTLKNLKNQHLSNNL